MSGILSLYVFICQNSGKSANSDRDLKIWREIGGWDRTRNWIWSVDLPCQVSLGSEKSAPLMFPLVLNCQVINRLTNGAFSMTCKWSSISQTSCSWRDNVEAGFLCTLCLRLRESPPMNSTSLCFVPLSADITLIALNWWLHRGT